MKESKAIYVTKRDINYELNKEYQVYDTKVKRDTEFTPEPLRYEQKTQEVGCQYDNKRDNLICTCRHLATIRKRQEKQDTRYFGLPKQIYTYHGTRSFTDIGVGSVKALQRKKVKRIYLPETDDRGVGSSDLSSYLSRRSRQRRAGSYYDHKRTSSKCVGGILEYNTGCVMNEKLSPIIHTVSGSTSPRDSTYIKNIEIGSNTVVKSLINTTTQVDDIVKKEIEIKSEAKVEEIKPILVVKEDIKEMKSKTVDTNINTSQIDQKDKDTEKEYSSDSLVQHVHNLENPSDVYKQSRLSMNPVDPMENKLEREYRRIFAAKSKDTKSSTEKTMSDFKSTSTLKRRFEALRRGLVKKEDSKKSAVIAPDTSNPISAPSRKDVSINSDPPSLEGRSYSNTKTFSPFPQSYSRDKTTYPRTSHYRRSVTGKKERGSAQWSSRPGDEDSESQGVKGMFKLWGKKFNLEEDYYGKKNSTPKPSYISSYQPSKKPERKTEEPKLVIKDDEEEKKDGKRFFFFKKKNKYKDKPYKSKKGVTTGRCEVRDGLMIKIGGGANSYVPEQIVKEPEVRPDEYEDIVRRAWLTKFLSHAIESRNSVKVRWNNKTYPTSSSTVFELMDTVYKDTGVVFRSKSQVTVHSSYRSYTKQHVNFVHQNIEAWMIPKTMTDSPMLLPAKMRCRSNEERKDNIEVRISDQKWFIDKSKAFSHKIEVVLHSNNMVKLDKEDSSEYLRIEIPQGFFIDSSSDDNNKHTVNQSSDEEVFKIVEYETGSDLKKDKPIRNFDIGDHKPNNIKVTVSVKDSNDDPKALETMIKRPPGHRSVSIQGSHVYIPKRCDVIGVGIITQRDLRVIRKPILKIQDDYSDEEESEHNVLRANKTKCELAESYLQDYYRHCTPLGIDLYSWCVSDSHLRCCSENSRASFINQGDVTKSCPNIYDDFQASTIISSCGASSCSHCHLQETPTPEKSGWFGKFKKKPKDAQHPNIDKRVLPKDSIEVCKKRKTYATSNKSKWGDCVERKPSPGCQPISMPSNESKGAQNTMVECPKLMRSCCKPLETKPKKRPCKKHVSLPDCDTMNELLAKQLATTLPEGILAFKSGGCDACKKKVFCPKHATIDPAPSCEIPEPPCRASCESMSKPPCSQSKSSFEKPPSPPCKMSCPASPCKKSSSSCPPSPPPCKRPSCPPTPPPCPPTSPCKKRPSCPPSPPPCKKPSSCPSNSSRTKKKQSSCPPSPPPCRKPPPCPPSPPPCRRPPPCPSPPPNPPPCKRPPPCPSPPPSPPPCCKPPPSPPPCCKPPPSPPPCCKPPPSPPPCCRPPPCPSPPPSPPPCKKPSPSPCKSKPSLPPCKKPPPCPPPCPPSPPPCKKPCTPTPSCKRQVTCPPTPPPCKKPSRCPHSPPSCPHVPPCPPSPPSCPHTPPCPPLPPPCPHTPPCPPSPPPCPHTPPCPPSPPPCPHTPPCPPSPPPCPHTPPCPPSPPPCPHTPPCPPSPPPCPHTPPCPPSPPPCPHTPPCPPSPPPCPRPPPSRPKCPHDPPCPPPPKCCRSKPCPMALESCPSAQPVCCAPDPSRCPALPPPCKKGSLNICKKFSPFFRRKTNNCPASPPCKPIPCKESFCRKMSCQEPPGELPPCKKPKPSPSDLPPCKKPKPSPCDLPPCKKPKPSPCDSPPCKKPLPSPCQKFSTTSCSFGSLDAPFKYSPIHPCPQEPERPKMKMVPCSSSPCNNHQHYKNKPKYESRKTATPTPLPHSHCDECRTSTEDFPWPTKNQVSNQSSTTSLYQVENSKYGQCEKSCPLMPKLSCDTIPSPKKECKQSCPNRQKEPRSPCAPVMQCPPPKQPPCPPPPKTPSPSEVVQCRSKSKVSGLYLKMKPVVKKKTCSKDCTAWGSGEMDEGCISLNSQEKITIRLKKDTCSTDEIREGLNIKVQDEDGMTLFERKDYRLQHADCNDHRPSVLGDMYKASEVRRVTTDNSSQDIGSDKEQNKKTVEDRSDASIANLIEIQFKLKVTQGEKTTEINIANDEEKDVEGEEKIEILDPINKTPQEIFVVNDGAERPTETADPKNDINIRIVIKNFKPKAGKNKSINMKTDDYCKDFSKKISAKFHTVSTGYSDVLHDDNVFSIHRATVDLTSSVDKSKTQSNKSEEIMSEALTDTRRDNYIKSEVSMCRCATTDMSDSRVDYDEVKSIPSTKYSEHRDTQEYPEETDTEKQTENKYDTDEVDTDKQTDHKYDTEETDTDKPPEPKYDTEETDTDKLSQPKYDTFMSTDTDDQEAIPEENPYTDKSKSIEVIVKPHTKDEKKEMLKRVMEKAHETKTKNKTRMRKLRDMLKVILTSDSSDHEDTKLQAKELANDVTYASLKPNYFRDSDSMNNYYRTESNIKLSDGEINRQVVYPSIENNSECSNSNPSDALSSGGSYHQGNQTPNTGGGCMCSTFAQRLKLATRLAEGGGCCCSAKPASPRKNEETTSTCDLKKDSDLFQYEYRPNEYVDVETQNSRYLTSKINSTNLSLHRSTRSSIADGVNVTKLDSGIINLDERNFSPLRNTYSPAMNVRNCEMRTMPRNTILTISDEDKIVLLSSKPNRLSAECTKCKVKEKKKRCREPVSLLRASDILQSYETKKAVLEIYTEKTISDDGEHLVAKLPKFVYDRENEIHTNYDAMAADTDTSCKKNIVMMAINR